MNSTALLHRAKEILEEEREALDRTLAALDGRFVVAVQMIASCKGKIVVTGVGKSGLIGQKIVATLNSTGTTAVFLHGGDGLHGDLGVLDRRDVVLILSYSGTTIEVLSILPIIQRIGAKIIAMVGDLDSPLAKAAHAHLPIMIRREACSMNLAPTSSTAAMLALGDALALVLSEMKGFREEDFALYHPAGALGRRLLLRVRDLMHGGEENPMTTPTASAADVTDLLSRTRLGAVNVVESRRSRKLVGIITDGDVRRALSRRQEFFNLRAKDLMTRNPVTVDADVLASRALELMENRASQISVLPVVGAGGRALGVVRVHDLLQLRNHSPTVKSPTKPHG